MKYHNQKTNGFASKCEAKRAQELMLLERAGQISNLRQQVPYELLPSQRGQDGRVVERACKYIADFVFDEDGQEVVCDAKGYRTPEYRLKRKLMLFRHGIQIREI